VAELFGLAVALADYKLAAVEVGQIGLAEMGVVALAE